MIIKMIINLMLNAEHALSHLLISPVTSLDNYSPVQPDLSVDINLGNYESDNNIDNI